MTESWSLEGYPCLLLLEVAPEPQFIEEAPALDGAQLRDDLRVLAPAPVPAADELVVAATVEEADARALVPGAHYAKQNNENNAIAPDLFLRACTICLLNRLNMIILPCGHLIMYSPCSEEHGRRRFTCTICRSPIESIIRVYYAYFVIYDVFQ